LEKKSKPRLLASAGSLQEIAKIVGRYWYSDTAYDLREAGGGIYTIHWPVNSTKPGQQLSSFQVRLHRGRHKFEELLEA
jgi:hypothetical protein